MFFYFAFPFLVVWFVGKQQIPQKNPGVLVFCNHPKKRTARHRKAHTFGTCNSFVLEEKYGVSPIKQL
jgi:hypothetical protein